jgi:hypothetical protein
MRTIVIALVIAGLPVIAQAQDQAAPGAAADRDVILAVVQRFFDTMADRDVEGARRLVIPEGRFFAVADGNDRPGVRSFTNEEYLQRLAGRKENVRERFSTPEVRIHGRIAVVGTPYDFWIDGRFSHCGVDAFDFVKTEEGWKIAGGIYTVERTGCTPSLGPPK